MTYPNTVISMPSQLFTMRTSFKAMANGNVYVGAVDTDPTIPTNQIQVYIEQENGTLVPVAQPIKINSAGLLTYSGQVQKFVLTNTEYSMAVLNAYGVQEHYFPRVYDQGISAALEVEKKLIGKGSVIYRGKNGVSVAVGDTVVVGANYLQLSDDSEPYIARMIPQASGLVTSINESNAVIGGQAVYLEKWNPTSSVSSIERLRLVEPIIDGQTIIVSSNGDGGVFIYDQSDNSTTDDTGIVIVTPGGARWKRKYKGSPDIAWFDFDLTGVESSSSLLELVLNRYGKLIGDTDEDDKLLIDQLVTITRSVNWRFDFGLTIDCKVKNGRAMIVTAQSYFSKNLTWQGNHETSEGLVTVCDRVKEYGGGYYNFYSNFDDGNSPNTTSRQVNDCDYFRSSNQTWKDIKSDGDGVADNGNGTVRGIRFVNRLKDAVFKSPTFDTIINETALGGFIFNDADAIVGQGQGEDQKITIIDPTFIDCQKRCVKSQSGPGSHTKIKGGSCEYTLGTTSDVSVPSSQANGMLNVVTVQGGKLTISDEFEFKSGVIQALFSVTDSVSACGNVKISDVIYNPTYSAYVATSRSKYFIMDVSNKIGVTVKIIRCKFNKCEISATLHAEDCFLEHNKFIGGTGDTKINIDVLANCVHVFNRYDGANATNESGLTISGCRFFKSFGNNFYRTRNGIVLKSTIDAMPSFEGVSNGDSFNSIFGTPIVNEMTTYKDNFVYWPGYSTTAFNSPIINTPPSTVGGSPTTKFLPITLGDGLQYKIALNS